MFQFLFNLCILIIMACITHGLGELVLLRRLSPPAVGCAKTTGLPDSLANFGFEPQVCHCSQAMRQLRAVLLATDRQQEE